MSHLLLPVLSTLLLAMAFWAGGISLGVAWFPRWSTMDAQAIAEPAHLVPAIQGMQRCPHCGWIESKREILSTDSQHRALGIFEYTMRRHDGSSSVFQQPLPIHWRLGERLILIEGASARRTAATTGTSLAD
jgi:hypothetical protein